MKSDNWAQCLAVPFAVLGLLVEACDKKSDAASTAASSDTASAKPSSSAASAAKSGRPAWLTGLMPDDVTADKAIAASDLKATLMQWVDREITATGYATFSSGTEGDLGSGVEIAAQPGSASEKSLLRCSFGPANKVKHADNKTMLTFKGTVDGVLGKDMLIHDCAILETPIAGGDAPIAVEKLVPAYMGWYGKEVTLTGLGNGATSSTSKIKGVETVTDLRVDIDKVDADGRYVNQAGCHLNPPKLDPGFSELTKRLGPAFTVRGTIKSIYKGRADLEPCVIVSK